MTYLTQAEVEALLGRSLTSAEQQNLTLYQEIAIAKIENLLCATIDEILDDISATKAPADLALVIARYIGGIGTDNEAEPNIGSKKVEDFSVTYDNSNSADSFLAKQNQATLAKYSHCGAIIHGKTLNHDPRYYHDDGFLTF